MTITLQITIATHRGRVRERNEDTAGVAGWTMRAVEPLVLQLTLDVQDVVEMVVADGLGGHAGGAEASQIAVEAFFAAEGVLTARIGTANEAVHAHGAAHSQLAGLATTLAGIQVRADGSLTVFHLGDSRVYRLVNGFLAKLTDDDKHADGGLTQVLGGALNIRIEPHMYEAFLATDTLLICSDGLTAVLDDETIAETLALPQRTAAERLLDLTLDRGAPDNVTMILCAPLR